MIHILLNSKRLPLLLLLILFLQIGSPNPLGWNFQLPRTEQLKYWMHKLANQGNGKPRNSTTSTRNRCQYIITLMVFISIMYGKRMQNRAKWTADFPNTAYCYHLTLPRTSTWRVIQSLLLSSPPLPLLTIIFETRIPWTLHCNAFKGAAVWLFVRHSLPRWVIREGCEVTLKS